MSDFVNLILESERVCLKPLTLDYRDVVFLEFTPEVARYMYPKPYASLGEAIEDIRCAMRQQQIGCDLHNVILHRFTREFLGVCGIHRINTDTPEFAIWLKQLAQGHGYGREAIHRLKHWADEYLDYRFISYSVDQENYPSRRIPESLGGKIARQIHVMSLSGRQLNLLEYRIDWLRS
ncbi:GNAT family N-acetyltransferase [Leptolyngbya sp. AN02str]|uniref:GNAT family N-acetyltransferase n=1 Tax=Leptolyngbya sp. AN02str TaxID=3423363 RepID=UPI003D323B46